MERPGDPLSCIFFLLWLKLLSLVQSRTAHLKKVLRNLFLFLFFLHVCAYVYIHEQVKADKFCRTACSCPGQVRWHAGWKMQRLRGLQMAMVYGRVLSKALSEFKQLAAEGKDLWGKVKVIAMRFSA